MRSSTILALAAGFTAVNAAAYQGFNYGATQTDGSVKDQQAFQDEFAAAKKLAGTNGAFTAARLYTTIQGTAQDATSAIPAAIAEDTQLLLGMWASSGETTITNEIAALKNGLSQYGDKFASLVVGISVGSEDLYRISPTGLLNKENPGADPDTLVGYIKQVRDAVAGTALAKVPIGHVDTWTAWVNGSNSAVVDACDWIGVDAYPYFQNTMPNGIENGASLFFDAYDATVAVAKGKDVWITETGWPVSGKTSGAAVPGTDNAKTYWDQVGCAKVFGQVNTFWFTLQDAYPTTPNPSFGILGADLNSSPLYDLSCSGVSTGDIKTASSSVSGASFDSTAIAAEASQSASTGATSSASAVATGQGETPAESASNGVGAGPVATLTQSTTMATATGASTGGATGGSGSGSGSGSGTSGGNSTAPTAGAPSSSASISANSGNGVSASSVAGVALAVVMGIAALL